MASLARIPELRAELIETADSLLGQYPGIPVLHKQTHPLTVLYDELIREILANVPLDRGTPENKRSDARRRIDEYDDGATISAKEFTLLKSSAEIGQWLGQHRHERTGMDDGSSNFVEWFRMISAEWIIFVSQYTRNAVGKMLAWPTTAHPIRPGDLVLLAKNQAHTLYMNPGSFQWVLPTTFTVEDLIPAKLQFAE